MRCNSEPIQIPCISRQLSADGVPEFRDFPMDGKRTTKGIPSMRTEHPDGFLKFLGSDLSCTEEFSDASSRSSLPGRATAWKVSTSQHEWNSIYRLDEFVFLETSIRGCTVSSSLPECPVRSTHSIGESRQCRRPRLHPDPGSPAARRVRFRRRNRRGARIEVRRTDESGSRSSGSSA